MSLINVLKRAKQYSNVIAVGDIHGQTSELGYRIKKRYNIENSVIILCGDIGVGFHKFNYHKDDFARLDTIAKSSKNLIIVVRGNHDDPTYFDGSFNMFTNIAFVPDYTVVETKNQRILCVGGGVSIDRTDRKLGSSYWGDAELPVYDEELLKSAGEIDVICAHGAPSWCEPSNKDGIDYWISKDSELSKDIDYERKVMDQIFNYLEKNTKSLNFWVYGHYHMSKSQNYDGMRYRAIDCMEFFPIPDLDRKSE